LRGEAFNLFNHPNFATFSGDQPQSIDTLFNPNNVSQRSLAASLSPSGPLGQLNQLFQIGAPRSLQFALRLRF